MAACRGLRHVCLIAAPSGGLQSAPRLSPLFVQTRNKTLNKSRGKAPHVAKVSVAWGKTSRNKLAAKKEKVSCLTPEFLARVPVDDVWIRTYYPRPRFPLEECLVRHQEYADPAMLDNMDGLVYADMELNMKTGKKGTKFASNVRGVLLMPHQFQEPKQQKTVVFCKTEEDIQKAKDLGATFVGGDDIVKQVAEGLINKDDIDVFLCTADAITSLISIRPLLRDKFPSKARGSVGNDIEEMWNLYSLGVSYASQKETDAVARLQVPLGQLNMSVEQLVENFNAYVSTLCKGRAKTQAPLITEVVVVAPPSYERFMLQVENYVPGYETEKKEAKKVEEDEDESDDEEDERSVKKK